MKSQLCWLLSLSLLSLSYAAFIPSTQEQRPSIPFKSEQSLPPIPISANHSTGWYDPYERDNGTCLTKVPVDHNLGEPLNIIISGNSDPRVLTLKGLIAFFRSIKLAPECFNLHSGSAQLANLGDGYGWRGERIELRQSYPILGTCLQTLIGGNHFRAWKQNGPLAPSGAWFLAASIEYNGLRNHDIIPNGYDLGRDQIVKEVTGKGGTCWRDECFEVQDLEWAEGVATGGAEGINHNITHDGRIAVLTVAVTPNLRSNSSSFLPFVLISSFYYTAMHERTLEAFISFLFFCTCLIAFLKWRLDIKLNVLWRWAWRNKMRLERSGGGEMCERSRLLGGEVVRVYL